MRLGEAPDRRGAARRGCPWRLLDLLVQQGAQQLPARARRLHDPRHQPRPQRGGPTTAPAPDARPPAHLSRGRCTAGRAPRWARSGSCSSARGGPSRRAA